MSNISNITIPVMEVSPWEQTFRNVINDFECYWTPIVVIFGIIGNILSLFVFVFSPLKRMSWSVYLAALAVSDTGFLICVFVSWCNLVGIHLYHMEGWCQFFVYLTYVCGFLSVWYIVAFTVERYIVVCFPLRRQVVCSPHRARMVVAALAIFALVLYTFAIWTSTVQPMHGYCGFCVSEETALLRVMANVDMIITLIIPFIIILVLNSIIIYTVLKYNRKRVSMTTLRFHRRGGSPSRRGNVSSTEADEVIVVQNEAESTVAGNSSVSSTRGQARVSTSKSIIHMTKMLVIVSSAFLLLNLPSHIIRICAFLTYYVQMNMHILTTFRKLFLCIYYANFAINFLLYSACGGSFRNALSKMICQMKLRFCGKLSPCCRSKHFELRSQNSVTSRKQTCISMAESRHSSTKLTTVTCNHMKNGKGANGTCSCQNFTRSPL